MTKTKRKVSISRALRIRSLEMQVEGLYSEEQNFQSFYNMNLKERFAFLLFGKTPFFKRVDENGEDSLPRQRL